MVMTLLDPIAQVGSALSTEWDNTETSNITPDFTFKAEFVRKHTSYQVIYYQTERQIDEIGRGTKKDWTDLVTIEVRVKDNTNDTVFNEMCQQVFRIIGAKRVTIGGGYDYWTYTSARDESHRGNNWYRLLIRTELKAYAREVDDTVIDGCASTEVLDEVYDGGDSVG